MATERYAGLFWDVDGDDPPLDADGLDVVGSLSGMRSSEVGWPTLPIGRPDADPAPLPA